MGWKKIRNLWEKNHQKPLQNLREKQKPTKNPCKTYAKTKKPTKISFVDEQTGEVFEISRSKYDNMTVNQRNTMLKNFKARSRIGEDLSDKGRAQQRKKLAAAKASRTASGGKTVNKRKGGSVSSKPRGCGTAMRGFGKGMK